MIPNSSTQIDHDNPALIEERNNRKLTADKIRQILSKILNNPTSSAKRWVWELMQNAKDIPSKFGQVSVQIILSKDKLEFKHNGDPFLLKNIFGLIQQVSTKSSDNSDEEVTGKFGTGFICTHLLSDIIDVNGIVLHRGHYKEFGVKLDRSGRNSEELLPKIEDALDHIKSIDDNEQKFPIRPNYDALRTETTFDTRFTYYLTSVEKFQAAKSGIEDLVNTLPVTLVNLPKIKRVEIIDNINQGRETYTSTQISNDNPIRKFKVQISSNGVVKQNKNFLSFNNAELTLTAEVDNFESLNLILPKDETPRLYRDFPLIGSQKFHFPFLLNGLRFNPTEDRNGLVLHSTESEEAAINRDIIEKAIESSKEFTKWLISQNVKNRFLCATSRIPIAPGEPTEFSKNWIKELQISYRDFLLEQELVENDANGITRLNEAFIPDYGNSHDTKTSFFYLAASFLGNEKVPRKDLILQWIETLGPKDELDSWKAPIHYDIDTFLKEIESKEKLETLVEIISGESAIQWLNKLYDFLIQENETEKFNQYAIIPNQHGDFLKLEELQLEDKSSIISDEFLDVLEKLGDNWRDRLIHREVILKGQNIEKRGLSDASVEINKTLKKEIKNNNGVYENEFIKKPNSFLILTDILSCRGKSAITFNFKDKVFVKAKELIKFEQDFINVENVEGFNFDPALKLFIRFIHGSLEQLATIDELTKTLGLSYKQSIIWLDEYFSLLEKKENFSSLLDYGNIIPNRDGVFKAKDSLQRFGTKDSPLDIDNTLIDILFNLDSTQNWREELLYDEFSLEIADRKFEELGLAIDNSLKNLENKEREEEGTLKAKKSSIIDLINWIKFEGELATTYLPYSKSRTNALWFEFSTDEEVIELIKDEKNLEILKELGKADLDKSKLSELISIAAELQDLGHDGLKEILIQAEDILDQKKHFHFMKETGESIEELFRQALDSESLHIDIEAQGWGSHDFRIYNRIYPDKELFIEIKSYSHGNTAPLKFALSQIKKSFRCPEKYMACLLERPLNEQQADINYLKTNLKANSGFMNYARRISDDIDSWEKINESRTGVKLVISQREEPRVQIPLALMTENTSDFNQLISHIKRKIE